MKQCVFCGFKDGEKQYATSDLWGNSYDIIKCAKCAAFYLSPFPSKEILSLAYDETYYGCSEKKFKGPIEKGLDFFRKQRAKKCSKLIKDGDKVLDIGCGNGQFLNLMKKYGTYELYGSELEGKSAQRAAQIKDINLKIGHFNCAYFPKKSFALISLFHVFEHLSNPRDVLQGVDFLLKENGYLVMSFPNINSFQSRFFKGKWLHLDPPRHLFFFTPKIFKSLMAYKGYKLVSESYFSPEQNPYGFVQSLLNLMQNKREVLFEHLKGNVAYTKDVSNINLFFQKIFFTLFMPIGFFLDIVSASLKKGATVEFIFKKNPKK